AFIANAVCRWRAGNERHKSSWQKIVDGYGSRAGSVVGNRDGVGDLVSCRDRIGRGRLRNGKVSTRATARRICGNSLNLARPCDGSVGYKCGNNAGEDVENCKTECVVGCVQKQPGVIARQACRMSPGADV